MSQELKKYLHRWRSPAEVMLFTLPPAPSVSYRPWALRAGIPDRCWLLCPDLLVPTPHHCILHSPSLHSALGPTSSNQQTCSAWFTSGKVACH